VKDLRSSARLAPFERMQRIRARSWVLQILYAWESHGPPPPPLEEVMEATFRIRRVAEARKPLIRGHIARLQEHLDTIDQEIERSMENWRLSRLSRVDRSVLRLAVSELLYSGEVPAKVALQEGIRLAGQYGGEESHRFVNGVLDAVYRRHGGDATLGPER
jgi:transcription antitermination protein NusB